MKSMISVTELLLLLLFAYYYFITLAFVYGFFSNFAVKFKDQECMNSNSKLKIVWMVCGVAIVLLFCTQAYWLHLQCQYSLDQQVEQFKKDCDEVLAQDLKNRKSCRRIHLRKVEEIRLCLR